MGDVFVLPGVDLLENVTDDLDGQLNENAEGCLSDNYEVNSLQNLCLFQYKLSKNIPIVYYLFQSQHEHLVDSPELGTRLYFQPDYSYGCLMKKWSL